MQWPPNITALLVAFAEAFQGIEVTGKMALKTGENFLRKHWQSTEKEERKGTVTTFFEQWNQHLCLLYFGCLISSKIQTLVHYFQTFSAFFFFLRMNWQSESIPPSPPKASLHSVLSTLIFNYRTCVSASVCADELGCSFLLSVSSSSSSKSFNSCSISFLASLTLEYSL